MRIKFSHHYPKLHKQTTARLLAIELHDRADFTEQFIEYDTVFEGGRYPLPDNKYMVLVFLGNNLIPFTTVRRWEPEKERYYQGGIGKVFEVEYIPTDIQTTNAPPIYRKTMKDSVAMREYRKRRVAEMYGHGVSK